MHKEQDNLGIKRLGEDLEGHDEKKPKFANEELPIGVPSIEDVLSTPYYVDKTDYAYKLLSGVSKYIFLSRPRRFGKSLFVSTLEEIAKGNKELFKNCWIGKSDYKWEKYPVIKFSFAGLNNISPENLLLYIENKLEKIALSYNLFIEGPIWQSKLEDLVDKMIKLEGYAEQVVFLLDEYDAPFINVKDNNIKEGNLKVVRDFLTVLKELSSKIHLEFVTGVSAYCFNDFNSGPNNLCDITLKPDYACITGYKETDLLDPHSRYYQRIIDIASAEECSPEDIVSDMRSMYNGYKFSTNPSTLSVYNPWSTLNFLQDGELDNYWINSGTPTFLIHRFNNKAYFDLDLSQPIVSIKSALTQSKENNLTTVGEMFQSGYLTIDKYQNELSKGSRRKSKDPLLLKFPNNEIKDSFYDFLSGQIGKSVKELSEAKKYAIPEKISTTLSNVDIDGFIDVARTFFSSIPYNLSQQDQNKNEAYYHTVLHSILECSGMYPKNEDYTNKGRIDIVLNSLPHVTYIFELKHGENAASVALGQIKNTLYREKFLNRGKDIVVIGINFSSKERNITEFQYECYDEEGNITIEDAIVSKYKTRRSRNTRSHG